MDLPDSSIVDAIGRPNPTADQDRALLPGMIEAVRSAGAHMLTRYPEVPGYRTRDDVVSAIYANDEASLEHLKPGLTRVRPDARWVEDELESGPLEEGEWWVTDPVEGNINHCHGISDWAITATLVRDNSPTVTTVYLPLTDQLYAAVRGGGATLDGRRLRTSTKTELSGAMVGTGQARPGESTETFERIGLSMTAMLKQALVVRASVPATLLLAHVAAGRMEAFWQFSQVRSGLLSGALLVSEAGGIVSDVAGKPWNLDSPNFLAATPALHPAAVEILSSIP
jgi:myo-inositol-1(or 4)-monophosphatase